MENIKHVWFYNVLMSQKSKSRKLNVQKSRKSTNMIITKYSKSEFDEKNFFSLKYNDQWLWIWKSYYSTRYKKCLPYVIIINIKYIHINFEI